MADKNIKKAKKGAKKGFYEVEAPMTSVKISLYGSAPEDFEGKIVTIDLTRNLRGKSFDLRMRVNNHEGKLKATPISLMLAGSYVRRSMRRGADYVEDSFDIKCRDGIVKVKPLLITRRKVSKSVRRMLRENTKKTLESFMKIRNVRELFSDIISNKTQKTLSSKLKKVYPLALCEIRVFEVKENAPFDEYAEGEESKLDEGIEFSEIETAEEIKEEKKEDEEDEEDKEDAE